MAFNLRKAEGDVYTWEDAEPLFIPMNDWSGIPTRTIVRATTHRRPLQLLCLNLSLKSIRGLAL